MSKIIAFLDKFKINLSSESFAGDINLHHRNCTIRKTIESIDDNQENNQFTISLIDNSLDGASLFSFTLTDDLNFISGVSSSESFYDEHEFLIDADEYFEMLIQEYDGE